MASNQVLPSREQTLFRHLVQNYESKQYKKGLKTAEQILRKHPNHGDTQAMKALILNTTGKQEEAFELGKLALKNAMKSHVCWHVYGLLYRSVKNYEEATKAYRFALRLDPESQQIQRDLALMQVQTRDYAGFVQSRNAMLQLRPQLRQNWTALAVALHMNGDLEKAENVLLQYEGTLKVVPPKNDIEHSEACLYKNQIIAETGNYERALAHLEEIYKTSLDRTAVMELKAEYLLKLDKKTEAEKAYRALLARNNEQRAYYLGLEKALGLDRENKEDQEKLKDLYQSFADKSTRLDAARRIPLDFLHGEAFRTHADTYLRRMFSKGVPSTFANVKQLYEDPEKRAVFEELAEGYAKEEPQTNGGAEANGSADGSHKTNGESKAATNWPLSVNYFLAQHYNYPISQDLTKALQYIEKAISINPSETDYTYHMARARIFKHQGNFAAASKAMNEAREMDLRDRYINTKCAKYQLRNDEHDAAVETMGLFTRKEAVGGPVGDLLDMQCVWFFSKDGESYLRQGNLASALKRFTNVYDMFEIWFDDQFDFHTFNFRKGMIRAYVDMVRWEDRLKEHPFFTRVALSAIKIYLMLADNPELAQGQQNGTAESAAERKKAAKKAKKEAEKAEAERKANIAKQPQPKAADEEGKPKTDTDPNGTEALKKAGEKPLEEVMKFLTPLLEMSPKNVDGQIAGFEVYIRKGKS
jgi:peptide alpha-N-acetyltransferase